MPHWMIGRKSIVPLLEAGLSNHDHCAIRNYRERLERRLGDQGNPDGVALCLLLLRV